MKNKIFSEGAGILLYSFNTIKLKPDDFIYPEEKEILALMTLTFFKGMKEIKNNQSI